MHRNLLCLALLLIPASAWAQEAKLAPIAHLIDSQTMVVVRIDLAKIDVPAVVKLRSELDGIDHPPEEIAAATKWASEQMNLLRENGGEHVWMLFGLADVEQGPANFVVSLKPGAKVEQIRAQLVERLGPSELTKMERSKNTLVVGTEASVTRLLECTPVARPDLAAAFASAGDSALQVAAALPADAQRVVRELVAELPAEIGGGEGKDLVNALQWTSLAIDTPPKIGLKWTIQSMTDADAVALRGRIVAALDLAGKAANVIEIMPRFAELATRLTPAVKGNRLELSIAGAEADAFVKQIQEGPLKLARASAGRMQSTNNLKQIALAMHNYHDTYRKFPAAASLSKDGKPLLSWRVKILPFIEESALYDQFKHDEPWDSEHNKKLIDKMPRVYLDPAHPQLAKDGKTTYVLPVGEKSPFGGKDGVFIANITDGTSNTLMTVDVPVENAVVWTKPDDWNFNPEKPGAGLLDGKRKNFLASFCDGSVRTLPADIDLSDLRRLVQMNDGEVISKQY
jgi:hypothetical protein